MPLGKLDLMYWFVLFLCQIKYQEILGFVDNKELTESGHKFTSTCHSRVILTEEQRAPLDLDNWELANIVPDCDWGCVVVMEHTIRS